MNLQSVKEGGGTKESAADTLDTLLASGAVDMKSANTLLPIIQKYASATGADSKDLALIAIRLKQTFGIQDKDMSSALNMAIVAGQRGSLELPSMAKWLPQQLASASNNGMKGLDDFAVLLGLNQAAAITAGTSDQAGNNVVNLLGKINSKDAANAAEKIIINGKGIDLPGSIAAARGKGINSLDAFMGIVDKIIANNPEYKKLEAKLATAKGGERQETLDSMRKILEGSAIGQIIADREALMALIGYRSNKTYAKQIETDSNAQKYLPKGKAAGDINYDLMSSTSDFNFEQLKSTKDFAEMDSIKPLSDVLGNLSNELTKYSSKYPELTTSLAGATIGIKSLATAAAVWGGFKLLSGSSIGGGAAAKVPLSNIGIGGISALSIAALSITAGTVAIKTTQDYLRQDFAKKDIKGKVNSIKQGTSGYSFVDIGLEVIKDRLGFNDSKKKGSTINIPSVNNGDVNPFPVIDGSVQSISSSTHTKSPENGSDTKQPLNITTKLVLDGREIAESVNQYNGSTAIRGSRGDH